MVTYRGYKTAVMFDHETAFGTGGTPDTAIKGKIINVTLNKVNNLIRTVGLGEGRNETFVAFGNFEVTWSMEYEIAAFDFLQFLIGSTSGAIGGSGTAVAPYFLEEADYRAYTGSGAELQTFTMEVGSEDSSATDDEDTITGGVINTASISLILGETVKCSLDGFAKTVTSSTSAAGFTPDTTKPWIFSQGVFKWNNSAVGRVTSATININNNYDPELGRQIGSRFPEEMEPGLRKYDWTITVKMTDTVATTLRDAFYGQADSPNTGVLDAEPTFYAVILNLSEGSATGDRNAQILLSDNAINDISKPVNIGENIVELTINGSAKKGTNDTTNKPFKWWTVPA